MHQENFLKYVNLKNIKKLREKTELDIAKALATKTIEWGSKDDIAIAIQTIKPDTKACIIGVYDGYTDSRASSYTALNIGSIFENNVP